MMLPIRIHTEIQVYICSTALTLLSGCHELCHIQLISSFHCSYDLDIADPIVYCSTALTFISGCPQLCHIRLISSFHCSTTLTLPIRIHTDIRFVWCCCLDVADPVPY